MDNYINTNKFNRILLSKYYIRRLEPSTQAIKTLLAYYLALGCEKYPNEEDFSLILQSNYDLNYEVLPFNVGTYEVYKFTLSGVNPNLIDDEAYTLDFLESIFSEITKPVIKNNSFDNEKLIKAKEMCISDIYYAYEDLDTIASNNAINYYFKNTLNDFQRICSISEINKITSDELYEYYQKLINEYNTSYMVGNIGYTKVSENNKLFNSHLFIDRGKCNSLIIENKNTNQAYLRIIFDGNIFSNDNLYYPALFINEKFGGGISSDLFEIIREELGLCYSIGSTYYAASGVLLVLAVINKSDLNEILVKIDQIYDSLLDDFDLEFIKKQFIYDKYEELDNINTYLANIFYDSHFTQMIPSSLEIDRIKKVTMDDIYQAHKRLKRSFVYVLGGDLNE